MRRLLPPTATRDAPRLIGTRAARGFADGIASVLLASYLSRLGFTPVQIGAIATATLFGSALLLLLVGLLGHRFPRREVLLACAALMCLTGIAFYLATDFWALLAVAFVGTLNPSSGDVTLFLPTEQAVLAEAAEAKDRTTLFAWYNLAGAFAGALGSLAAGLPDALAKGSAAQASSTPPSARSPRSRTASSRPRWSPRRRPGRPRWRSRAESCCSSRRCSRSMPSGAASWSSPSSPSGSFADSTSR